MPIVACPDTKHLSIAEALNLFCGYMASGRITGGGQGGGGLGPLVVLMAPLVQLIFRGSGGRKTAFLEPQNGPSKVAKRPP